MKTVYLAGPISGNTQKEAKTWRYHMENILALRRIKAINPLRSEPIIGDVYQLTYADRCFGTPKAIAGKNYFDVANCDLTLAYLPAPSVGTIIEIGWAYGLRKPVVVVSDKDGLHNHPLIQESTNWVVPTFREATKIIVGLLGDYTNGSY